ncbi:hypothetical protein ECG_06555 [Echinococcus granulosus]|uniref:Expressed protein n=1 Tax=Echinococcus granulosus TaxID=6210 RepID=A0A068WGZ4_ECHGR|nr:hypothetical protein ECG_06555 [Echinococcus granulosus]CDS19355.1 expressed protein [Echinococcus granulosus]
MYDHPGEYYEAKNINAGHEINFEDARTANVNLGSGPKMCLYTHKNEDLYKKARYTQFMRWGVKDTRTQITRASV